MAMTVDAAQVARIVRWLQERTAPLQTDDADVGEMLGLIELKRSGSVAMWVRAKFEPASETSVAAFRMLVEIEWMGEGGTCPMCGRGDAHEPDCRLAEVIKAGK